MSSATTTGTPVKIPAELIDRVDTLVERVRLDPALSPLVGQRPRAATLRLVIVRGLLQLEAELPMLMPRITGERTPVWPGGWRPVQASSEPPGAPRMSALSLTLRVWRTAKGLTQPEAAARVGEPVEEWARWESGTASPPEVKRARIEEVTGIPAQVWPSGSDEDGGGRPS